MKGIEEYFGQGEESWHLHREEKQRKAEQIQKEKGQALLKGKLSFITANIY